MNRKPNIIYAAPNRRRERRNNMKLKKLASLALAGALTLGLLPAFSSPALATGGDSTYTITIPSELTVSGSGWNATGGISATGTLESGKKLTVTASSANSWALKSGDNSVGYTLATASTDTEATTSWEFTELSSTATKKDMGIIVEDYSEKPAGTYTDTVTFTAKVENAVTTRTVTFNTDTDGKTINKDGVTCDGSFDSYNNITRGGAFSVSSGQFTKIEVTAADVKRTGNTIEGWSTTSGTATWTGKSSTVPFGPIMGNSGSVTIVFTIEE